MTNNPKKGSSKRKSAETVETAPPVYFLSLELENVLCFKERQKLDLSDGNGNPAQWTVILGDNGVGKTTLLRCLAGAEIVKNRGELLPLIHESSFFAKWSEGQTSVNICSELITDYYFKANINRKVREQDIGHLATNLSFGEKYFTTGLRENRSQDWKYSWDEEYRTIASQLYGGVCCGYGATRKMGETSLGEYMFGKMSSSRTLFYDQTSLINAEEWLLQTDYAFRYASGQLKDQLEKQMSHVLEILKNILPEVEDIRIVLSRDKKPVAEFLAPYGWVKLSALGLGYRTMITWMVDLAAHLFDRYPDSPDPLAEPAIVLVDEIDLHLHPQWQRNIISFLTERFPNTQFIVTTHSPLVVQAARNANIVLLRREGDHVVIDNNPDIIDNWRADQILVSMFGLPTARPADVEEFILRRQALLSKSKLTKKDKEELQELESKIGSMPTAENPVDIRAMDIIRRAAQYLEQ